MGYRSTLITTALTASTLIITASVLAEDKPAVSVKFAKLAELDKLIASHKGKVVVVDIWSTT